uniref:MFS domain-containing protein n=1 Tax=Strongyloides venezuelensis TaxID=75913 RepID=A0A0K0EU77_STRVS
MTASFFKRFPWRLFVDACVHGTIGSIGDVICINIGIYSVFMFQFFKDSIREQYGEDNDTFVNTAFSFFSSADIIGNFLVGAVYVYLIKWFGSLDTFIRVRHLTVQLSFLLMLLAKLWNLYQFAIVSRILLGGSMFFGITENIFLAECSGEKYKDTVLLNLITYYTVVGMLLTPLAHDKIFGNEERWVYLYILGCVVSTIYLIYTWKTPESPKELYINYKNPSESEKSLKYYLGKDVNVEEFFSGYDKEMTQQVHDERMSIWQICKDKHLCKVMLLLLGVTAMTSISFYILVRPFLQIIYMRYGASISTSTWLHMSFQIIGITTSIGAPWVFKHIGQRKIITFYGSVIIFTYVCILGAEYIISYDKESMIPLVLCVVALLSDRASIGIGRSMMSTILMTDMTPNKAKDAMGQAITVIYNVLLVVQQFTYLQLFEWFGSNLYIFYVILEIAIFLFVITNLPKPKNNKENKTMDEGIQLAEQKKRFIEGEIYSSTNIIL